MTRSNLPSKRRRKEYSNSSSWFRSLNALKREIGKAQKHVEIKDEIVPIEDEDFEPKDE